MPLELDTDGIWCCLPSSFPENFKVHPALPTEPQLLPCPPNLVTYLANSECTAVEGDMFRMLRLLTLVAML